MIRITSKGFKGKGIYVGRPSPFGNPYPTKRSKYSKRVFPLKESLYLYEDFFKETILGSREFNELVSKYRKEGYLELDCWCVDKEIYNLTDVKREHLKCHAEIIAFYILKENEDS